MSHAHGFPVVIARAWIAAIPVWAAPSIAAAASALSIIGHSGTIDARAARSLYDEAAVLVSGESTEDRLNIGLSDPPSGRVSARIATTQGAPEGFAAAELALQVSSAGVGFSSRTSSSGGRFPEPPVDEEGRCCLPIAGEETTATAGSRLRVSFHVDDPTVFGLSFGDIGRWALVPGASQARVMLSRHEGSLDRYAIGLDRPGE